MCRKTQPAPILQRWKQQSLLSQQFAKDNGYSLIEVVTVVLMIAILAVIALPSWLAFVRRQQLNKANEVIYTTIQNAQQQAKKTKNSYSVFFRRNTSTDQERKDYLEFAIVRTKKDDGNLISTGEISTWQKLGSDVGVDSRKLLLGTNLSSENTADASISYTSTTPAKLTFDYMGTLPNASFGTIASGQTEAPGIKIIVAIPQGNTNTPTNVKRCVIIRTILGGMISEKNAKCN
jgi:prepilin-type N-terminal cleavage/methylation domain-containing protein